MGGACKKASRRGARDERDNMTGKGNIRFSTLVADTIEAHGLAWAAAYYAKKGLPLWQFLIFARGAMKA